MGGQGKKEKGKEAEGRGQGQLLGAFGSGWELHDILKFGYSTNTLKQAQEFQAPSEQKRRLSLPNTGLSPLKAS